MADGSVGKISLDIDITGDISKQISAISEKIGAGLKASVENSTKGMFKNVEKSTDKSMKKVKNTITGQLRKIKSEASAVMKSFGSIFKKIKLPKDFGIPKNVEMPQASATSTDPARGPPKINSGVDFEKVKAQIDNLSRTLDTTNTQIQHHQNKLADLKASYESAFNPDTKNKIQEEIFKTETKLNTLIGKSDQTGFKLANLDNKLQGASSTTSGFNKALEKTNATIKNTTNNLNRSAKATVNVSKNTSGLGKAADSIGSRFGSMGKTIRSAFKRVLIMATLYKAIRGFMSYMNGALATNKQFSNSLAQVKTNLQVAFMPIYQAILPAINALMSALAKVTTYVATFVSALFGKTYQQSFKAAQGLNNTKAAMEGVGKQAKKTAKEVKGSLAGFDEINTLDMGKDDAGSGVDIPQLTAPAIDMSPVESSMQGLSEKLKGVLTPTIEALGRLGKALEPLKTFVAKGLQDFYKNFLVPVGKWVFGQGLPRFIDAITKGLSLINWKPINEGLNNLWSALTPFAINVGEGLLWLWENVLVPLGTWTMNNVVPLFLDALAGAIRIVNNVVEALKPLGQWLWDSFLQPLAEWTGGVIVSILEGVSSSLSAIGDWISENQGAVENIAIIVGSFAAAWALVNTAVGIWNVIGPIAAAVNTAVSISGGGLAAVMGAIASPITIAIAIIGALIAVGVLLYKNWDKIKEFAGKLWDGIKDVFGKIGKWIGDTWDNVKKWTSEKWGNIKDTVSNAAGKVKDGISSAFGKAKDSITGAWDKAKENTFKVWGSIKDTVDKNGGGITGILKTATDGYKETWNKAFNKLDDITGGKMSAMRDSMKNIGSNIGSTLSSTWTNIKNKTSSVWEGIKSAITKPIETAKNTVKNIVDTILGFFKNIKLPEIKMPKIKMPHFDFSGKFSLSPPQVPKFKINWYDKGGIFNEPSVIGVGEKRPEFVGALDDLRAIVRDEFSKVNGNSNKDDDFEETGDLVLQVEGDAFGRIALKTINKRRRKAGLPLLE